MGVAGFSTDRRPRKCGWKLRSLRSVLAKGVLLAGLALALGSGAALLGCAASAQSSTKGAAKSTSAAPTQAEVSWRLSPDETVTVVPAKAVGVVDGDSLVVRLADGAQQEIRLIGTDAPELAAQRDVYGMEAARHAAVILRNQPKVFLEYGPDRSDKYGRPLAYVWLAKPSASPSASDVRTDMLNAKMLTSGYSKLYTKKPNTRYAELFSLYAEQAQSAKKGLWDPKLTQHAGPSTLWSPASSAASSEIISLYLGNLTSKKFHLSTCENAQKMRVSNRVSFYTREDAVDAGYVPCNICKP
jgi:micrococcal nuclease